MKRRNADYARIAANLFKAGATTTMEEDCMSAAAASEGQPADVQARISSSAKDASTAVFLGPLHHVGGVSPLKQQGGGVAGQQGSAVQPYWGVTANGAGSPGQGQGVFAQHPQHAQQHPQHPQHPQHVQQLGAHQHHLHYPQQNQGQQQQPGASTDQQNPALVSHPVQHAETQQEEEGQPLSSLDQVC